MLDECSPRPNSGTFLPRALKPPLESVGLSHDPAARLLGPESQAALAGEAFSADQFVLG
jgi:hypothetical protein